MEGGGGGGNPALANCLKISGVKVFGGNGKGGAGGRAWELASNLAVLDEGDGW